MSFTIPNEADAGFAGQSEIDKIDIDILVAAIKGNGVIAGCAVTAQGSPDMTLAVAAGAVIVDGVPANVTAGNVTITTAHATNPRYDLVVVDNAGAKSVTAGTAAASPVIPAIPANSVVLAVVYVPANDTAINSNQITDKRCDVPPLAIIRKTADETVNNSNTLQNDDHLKLQVSANSIWEFEMLLLTSSGSATPDWQWAWTVPSGTTMRWAALQQGANLILDAPATGTAQQALNTEGSTITSGSGASIEGGVYFRGVIIVGGTAGTIQLRWAQNTANASDNKVLTHSYLKARKIG